MMVKYIPFAEDHRHSDAGVGFFVVVIVCALIAMTSLLWLDPDSLSARVEALEQKLEQCQCKEEK